MFVIKAGIRRFLREHDARASHALYGALDLAVQGLLRKAVERAKANRKRIVTESDL